MAALEQWVRAKEQEAALKGALLSTESSWGARREPHVWTSDSPAPVPSGSGRVARSRGPLRPPTCANAAAERTRIAAGEAKQLESTLASGRIALHTALTDKRG